MSLTDRNTAKTAHVFDELEQFAVDLVTHGCTMIRGHFNSQWSNCNSDGSSPETANAARVSDVRRICVGRSVGLFPKSGRKRARYERIK